MNPALRPILPLLLLTLAGAAWCGRTDDPIAPGARPAINRPFAGAQVEGWTNAFERPGREVYDQRFRILEAMGLREGMRVADIGAGTGLFSTLFARAIGATGLVYAVDVSAGFVEGISARARTEGLSNIVPVRNTQENTGLRDASIDLAFVCDTYHHFEDPAAMLDSIRQALAPGGVLIIIDYRRLPNVSSPWILDHVRAGRDQVVREVTGAGFRLVEEPEFLRESYFLRFRKIDEPGR